jgi:hypothetical protein
MGIWDWLSSNAFDFFSIIGVIGSLWLTIISLRSETETRREANLLAITNNHRELWSVYLGNKELARVRDVSANTIKQPVTESERIFVGMVIHHLNSVYYATKKQLVVKMEGMRRDVAQFLSLPIPREVWDKIKVLQNEDFIAFVESCRNWK